MLLRMFFFGTKQLNKETLYLFFKLNNLATLIFVKVNYKEKKQLFFNERKITV